MRTIFLLLPVILLCGFCYPEDTPIEQNPERGQPSLSIEDDFEIERAKLSIDQFTIGEDATSGWWNFVYVKGAEIKKVRTIWNGGCCNSPNAQDLYYKNHKPILYVELSIRTFDDVMKATKKNMPLGAARKFYLRNSRLTAWIEDGRSVPRTDPRWDDQEKEVLDAMTHAIELYKDHLNGSL